MLIVAHRALVSWNDYAESHYIGDINPKVTPHTVVEVTARVDMRFVGVPWDTSPTLRRWFHTCCLARCSSILYLVVQDWFCTDYYGEPFAELLFNLIILISLNRIER